MVITLEFTCAVEGFEFTTLQSFDQYVTYKVFLGPIAQLVIGNGTNSN